MMLVCTILLCAIGTLHIHRMRLAAILVPSATPVLRRTNDSLLTLGSMRLYTVVFVQMLEFVFAISLCCEWYTLMSDSPFSRCDRRLSLQTL
jgi:hypothetical protein